MNKLDLQALVKKFTDIDINTGKSINIDVSNISMLKLRDLLIGIGKIYYENLEEQVYVVKLYGGLFKKNPAFAALHLMDGILQIEVAAKEGLIDQRTCEGVINEIKRKVEEG